MEAGRKGAQHQERRADRVYAVGDKVVCASHGAGRIVKIEQQDVLGREREYLTIQILHNRMTVMMPMENAGRRLRRVIGPDGVDEVVDVLRSDPGEMSEKWHARSKRIQEKLGTGEILEVAEVVRDLAVRRVEKGLALGEQQMLAKARKVLVSELMLARDLSEDEVGALLEDILGGAHAEGLGAC